MVTVDKLVEWRLAGETEELGENLPQRHFVHHKSYMTRPGFEPGTPRFHRLTQSLQVSAGTGSSVCHE
jgi:hypothetical protein